MFLKKKTKMKTKGKKFKSSKKKIRKSLYNQGNSLSLFSKEKKRMDENMTNKV